MHVGFFDLDEKQPCGWIHFDHARAGRFANNLFVHLAFWGNVNHHIALDGGLHPKRRPGFRPRLSS